MARRNSLPLLIAGLAAVLGSVLIVQAASAGGARPPARSHRSEHPSAGGYAALLARRLKIAAAELSATHDRVRVAELLAAVLAEHVDYAPDKLEQLGQTLERYRAS